MRDLMKTHAALLIVGVFTFVLMGAGQSLYGPALPAFSRGYGISIGTAGMLVSAHWIGCGIGVAAMYFYNRFVTPRHVLALMAMGAGLMSLAPNWWVVMLGAVVFGGGYGCSTVVFNPRMLRAFGARGPAMLSLLNATFGIGAIGAPLVFVALGNDPGLSYGICAAMAVAIWVGAGAASKEPATAQEAVVKPYRPHLPILSFAAIAIGLEACLIGLGPTALISAGETEVAAAQLLSAFFFAFLAARVLLIFTAHLLPSFTLFALAMAGAFASALVAATVAPGIGFIGLGVFAGLFFPAGYVTASRKMGDDSRVPSTIIAAGLVGGILAPLVLAPLMGGLGAHGFFWIVVAVSGALLVASLASLRSMNR